MSNEEIFKKMFIDYGVNSELVTPIASMMGKAYDTGKNENTPKIIELEAIIKHQYDNEQLLVDANRGLLEALKEIAEGSMYSEYIAINTLKQIQ